MCGIMKLEIELVPETCWYSNLRKNISQKNWDIIRKQCYKDANYKCQICGSDGKNQIFETRGSINGSLNCHEIWEYDDKSHIQKLKGFIALCNDCHMIKHLGFAGIQANNGLLDYHKLIDHFLIINNVTLDVFNDHCKKVEELFRIRSTHQWKIDLGEWNNLIKK